VSCEPHWLARIDAALVGEHGGALYAEARAHAEGCAACAATWRAACGHLAALERRPGRLPEAVEAAVLGRVLDALSASGDLAPAPNAEVVPVPAKVTAPSPPSSRRRAGAVGSMVGAAAVASITFIALRTPPETAHPGPSEGFQARGGETPRAGFQVFCVEPRGASGEPVVRSSGASGLAAPLHCDASGRLQFTYSVPQDLAQAGDAAVHLFATGPEGQVVWYWPRAGQVTPVEAGGRNVPLPGSFDVGALHGAGRWRITGVFSYTLGDRETLDALARSGGEAAVAAWAARSGALVEGAGLWMDIDPTAQRTGGAE